MSLESARSEAKRGNTAVAEQKYLHIIRAPQEALSDVPAAKVASQQEQAILELGELYRQQAQYAQVAELIRESKSALGGLAKSKTAKIIKTLIEHIEGGDDTLDLSIAVTRDCIEWAVASKLTFLRQSLQLKAAALLYKKQQYQQGLKLITELLHEYKKLDDKSSLVEVQLLESQIYHALRNLPKAKAALTSARTSANAIYCPTLLQAELDCQSGILNAEDRDYKTSFSYFFESFEGFHSQGPPQHARSILVLKYMLLTKIMLNLIDDVTLLLKSKNVVPYQSRDIDAMKAIAAAYANRSLHEFEHALTAYAAELQSDAIIKSHFNELYDNLLEQNLLKIIESYSVVELSHVAKTVGLSLGQVEGKLSQMILDKVFYGVLDQGNGWLVIYDEPRRDATYDASLELVKNLSSVVDLLYEKASSLN
ncbi:PCI domain-containing protein [[Candida] zeylanoides]